MSILSTVPLSVLGYRKDGRPIRLQAGAEDAPPATPPAAPAPPAGGPPAQQPAPPAAPAGPPAQAPAAQAPGQAPTQDDLATLTALPPDQLAKMVRDLRAENGKDRTTAKQQAADEARKEIAQQVAKALGLAEDETPDPAQLQAVIADKDTALRTSQIELAAWQSAARQGANAAALLDSRTFVTAVSKLDPTAADFSTQLDTAVKTAVDSNPTFRAVQAPARGGGEFPGGPGGDSKPTSLQEAVAARIAGTG